MTNEQSRARVFQNKTMQTWKCDLKCLPIKLTKINIIDIGEMSTFGKGVHSCGIAGVYCDPFAMHHKTIIIFAFSIRSHLDFIFKGFIQGHNAKIQMHNYFCVYCYWKFFHQIYRRARNMHIFQDTFHCHERAIINSVISEHIMAVDTVFVLRMVMPPNNITSSCHV